MRLTQVVRLGFDLSRKDGRYIRVRCSQCAACTINGVPAHERGCPNRPRK